MGLWRVLQPYKIDPNTIHLKMCHFIRELRTIYLGYLILSTHSPFIFQYSVTIKYL